MAAPSIKCREASFDGADGVVLVKKLIGGLNEPFLDGCALSGLRASPARALQRNGDIY